MTRHKVVIAGSYSQALRWCNENGFNPHEVVVLVNTGDENKVRGMILTDDDVAYAEGFGTLPPDRLFAFEQTIAFCQRGEHRG